MCSEDQSLTVRLPTSSLEGWEVWVSSNAHGQRAIALISDPEFDFQLEPYSSLTANPPGMAENMTLAQYQAVYTPETQPTQGYTAKTGRGT